MILCLLEKGISSWVKLWVKLCDLQWRPWPKWNLQQNKGRVVVTGMGVETSIGHTPDEFYNNLFECVSGISEIEDFDCSNYPTRIAGKIKVSLQMDGWCQNTLKEWTGLCSLCLLLERKHLQDGGITEDLMNEIDKTRCGILIGSAMGGMKILNDGVEALRVSYRRMNPFCVPFATTNMGSAMLSLDLGWMGPNYSISIACATSNFCILNAANYIIRGEAVWMLSSCDLCEIVCNSVYQSGEYGGAI